MRMLFGSGVRSGHILCRRDGLYRDRLNMVMECSPASEGTSQCQSWLVICRSARSVSKTKNLQKRPGLPRFLSVRAAANPKKFHRAHANQYGHKCPQED